MMVKRCLHPKGVFQASWQRLYTPFHKGLKKTCFGVWKRTCTEETCVPAPCPMALVSIPWVEQSNGRGRAGGAAVVVGHRC